MRAARGLTVRATTAQAITAREITARATSLRKLAARVLASLALAALAPAGAALAQSASLQVAQGPYYTGVPIDVQVVLEGFEEEPAPEVSAAAPDGATLDFVQARPQVSASMQIINGKVTRSRDVRFGFVYQVTASKPGRYTIGPFQIKQNNISGATRDVVVTVIDMPEAGGQRLRILIPEHPVFIGQRVPVTVQWWTENGLADRLFYQRLRVPFFLDSSNFQFLDEERDESRIVISVDLPGGAVDVPAEVRQENDGGKTWVIRSFTRTMIPVASGKFDLSGSTLYCEEATGFQRDLFGSRVPTRTRNVRVTARPQTLDVQAVPAVGRPASFAGAIGEGFSLEVAADRTVLQAGDPVKLTFTIHGDGSLDSASLPALAAAGLSPTQFRLPDGDVPGIAEAGGKRFEVTVRVVDPAVREIPPIEYSWFNPAAGNFESTRSHPIALSVRAATVVGAGDVVSATPAAPAAESSATSANPVAAPTFTLTGADLSIETDASKLRATTASLLGSPAIAWTAYAGGVLALLAGLFVRRRRSIDPVKAAFTKQMRSLRSQISSARSTKAVADALRRMAALRGHVNSRADGLDGVLASLDESTYAPGGAEAGVSAELRTRAVAVADAIMKELQ